MSVYFDDEDLPLFGFVGIVLAGGESKRMGRNKLLLEIAARPMIRHVVETVRGVVEETIVVTGHQAERIGEALARLPVQLMHIDPAGGMRAVISTAIASADPEEAILLCVGDQPRLTEREIMGLIEAWRQTDGKRAMVPIRHGVRGYPVVVPPNFDAANVDLSADDVLRAWPDHVVGYATRNPVYESSVDTPEDYRALFTI